MGCGPKKGRWWSTKNGVSVQPKKEFGRCGDDERFLVCACMRVYVCVFPLGLFMSDGCLGEARFVDIRVVLGLVAALRD
jgi:hypothetical protein